MDPNLWPLQAAACAPFRIGHKQCAFWFGRNAEVEQQIAQLRAELLHKEQENERVQMQLAKEKEERERAERQVGHLPMSCTASVSNRVIASGKGDSTPAQRH